VRRRWKSTFIVSLVLALPCFGCGGGSSGSAGSSPSSGSPPAVTVASQVEYYAVNDGTNFWRSVPPFPNTTPTNPGGGTVHQTVNADGSVTVAIQSAPGYADCGFYLPVGLLGNLNSIKITTMPGSAAISLNLWFDIDGNGEYFTWTSNEYQGVGGDAYILGPQSSGNALTVNALSSFTSMNPGGGNYTLAQLISGAAAASGITSTTRIAIWVGIAVNNGSSTATINSLTIN